MKIAVLLTTFDGEAYLRPQLDSILAQTHEDLELVAVDDGSTDATRDILAEYARTDRRVSVHADGANAGQNARLVEAHHASSADLIAVSDQDDVWRPEKLERLAGGIGEAAMAFGPSRLIDAEGREIGTTILAVLGAAYDPSFRLASLFRPLVSAHAMLVRRAAWSTASLQRQAVAFDRLMSLEAMFGRGLAFVEDAITLHRLHGASQLNGGNLDRALDPDSPRWKWRPWQFRQGLRQVIRDRFAFLTCMDHVGTSPAVDVATRAVFRHVYQNCAYTWFHCWRPFWGVTPHFEQGVLDDLLPFAGSAADAEAFRTYFRRLVFTPPHPQALRGFAARWGRSNDRSS